MRSGSGAGGAGRGGGASGEGSSGGGRQCSVPTVHSFWSAPIVTVAKTMRNTTQAMQPTHTKTTFE